MTIKELKQACDEISRWLEWDSENHQRLPCFRATVRRDSRQQRVHIRVDGSAQGAGIDVGTVQERNGMSEPVIKTLRLNWEPIKAIAIEEAEKLGHTLRDFKCGHPSMFGNRVQMSTCEICYGCCWICFSPGKGYGAGGRLLKYRCGTPEAAGLVSSKKEAQCQNDQQF